MKELLKQYAALIGIVVLLGSIFFTVVIGQSLRTEMRTQAVQSLPTPSISSNTLRTEFTSMTPFETVTLEQAQRSTNNFLSGQGIEAKYPVDVLKLSMQISVEDGSMSPITAEIFVPIAENKEEKFPLIVYAPGTTGLDDRCAPSREDRRNPSLGNYRNQMISQASQGYVVVMPNYEGLDNPNRIHYYFNADLEARTLLGTAKEVLTTRQTLELPIKPNTLFFGGYSQGGHASFAAVDRASVYAPELKISGVFGHGPTTDIQQFLLSNPNLASYFVYAYQEYYGDKFSAETILREPVVQRLDKANALCVDEAFAYNSTRAERTYAKDFLAALRDGTVEEKFAELGQILEENDAGLHYSGIPTLILQGKNDPIVTSEAQQTFANMLCENAVQVLLKEYDGLDHFGTRQRSFIDTNTWINSISAGERAPTSCI